MSTPKIERPDVCIYHDPCTDGFGAAWACYAQFGTEDTEYIPANHETSKEMVDFWIEKCTDRKVVVFDYSFPRELLEKLNEVATSFQVIDHHKSAKEALGDLDYCYFDMERSGAMLAWEACHDEPAPKLIEYIQDQDLWKWELPSSKFICQFLNSYERGFKYWDLLRTLLSTEDGRAQARLEGEAMLRKQDWLAEQICNDCLEEWEIDGHVIMAVNCPRILRVFVLDKMGKMGEFPFVGGYDIQGGLATWSLRSNHGTADVSAVAAKFPGGGGHAKAAGFTIPVSRMDFTNRRVLHE